MTTGSNAQKRGLGKGLGALIPQGSVFMGGRTVINVDINSVIPNPRQPRTNFNKEMLQDLADSIKAQGVIEPILTRMRNGKYELIAGERRLRAAKMAGITAIPVDRQRLHRRTIAGDRPDRELAAGRPEPDG